MSELSARERINANRAEGNREKCDIWKNKIPSTKHQIPNKSQIPMTE
jgi:hypothetical protein